MAALVAALVAEMLDERSGLDESAVRACKRTVADYLLANERDMRNDISIRDVSAAPRWRSIASSAC